jgi:hypothetical protein
MVGLLAELVPWSPSSGSAAIAAVLAISLAVHDLTAKKVRLPQRGTLIPQEVFFRSRSLGFLRFGVEFGSGVRTLIPSASSYILVVWMLVLPVSFGQALAGGLAFGIGRSIGPLQAVFADERHWSSDLAGTSRLVERFGSVLAVVGTTVVAVATTW